MKKILLIGLVFVFFIKTTHAQFTLKLGDFKYKITNYKGAIKSYQNYLTDDENQYNTEVIRKLGNAYIKSKQYNKAESTFAKLTIMDTVWTDVISYAEMLFINKKYDSVTNFISGLANSKKYDTRLLRISNSLKSMKQLTSIDTGNVRISLLPFNSEFSDYAVSLFQNGIIFSSNRITNRFMVSKKKRNNPNFIGLYYSSTEDGLKSVKKIASNLNKHGNYGPSSYHAKSRTMYYAVNYMPKKHQHKKNIRIHTARFDFDKNTWHPSKLFYYNSSDYACTTPYVNNDGTRLYFSSNMPGGIGGMDLYYCIWKDSIWSRPVNMGPKVNTAGDELYPFIDNNNQFFFASDGRSGLGGFDIYTFDLNNSKAELENLGAPFNSSADDFAYVKYTKSEKGYFSSSRRSGGLNQDVYSFERIKPTITEISISVIDNISNKLVDSSNLIIKDANAVLANFVSPIAKVFKYKVEPGKSLELFAKSSGFESNSIQIITNRTDTAYSIPLKKIISGCSLQGIVKNKTTGDPLKGVEILITNSKNTDEVYKCITDGNGFYSIKGLKKYSNYDISIKLEGFFPSKKNLKTLNTCISTISNTFDYVQDYELISGDLTKLENIYFDFNKITIRTDAAAALDQVVKLMQDNPEILVELYAHTDSRGTAKINYQISNARAKECVKYITSKGIQKYRIKGIGFGETKLLNSCDDTAECSESEHQQNRRTEIQVVGIMN